MSKTVAEDYYKDPRLQEAMDLIEKVISEHSKKVDKVKGANTELKASYEKMLEEFSKKRGGKLFYDYLGSGVGNGALVELADGSVKYDFITGIGVHYFGHSHPGVVKAQVQGSLSNTTMSGNLQQNVDSPKLFDLILEQANKYHETLKYLLQ